MIERLADALDVPLHERTIYCPPVSRLDFRKGRSTIPVPSEHEDKEVILAMEPGRRLAHTHFSPLGGQEDKPENYHTRTWTLQDQGGRTLLARAQDTNPTSVTGRAFPSHAGPAGGGVKRVSERG
jgi:hypothetical protein